MKPLKASLKTLLTAFMLIFTFPSALRTLSLVQWAAVKGISTKMYFRIRENNYIVARKIQYILYWSFVEKNVPKFNLNLGCSPRHG